MSTSTAFVSIGDLRKGRAAVSEILETAAAGCGTSGGAGKASCGSSGGPDDMPAEIWEMLDD